jgi:hypothetical protein
MQTWHPKHLKPSEKYETNRKQCKFGQLTKTATDAQTTRLAVDNASLHTWKKNRKHHINKQQRRWLFLDDAFTRKRIVGQLGRVAQAFDVVPHEAARRAHEESVAMATREKVSKQTCQIAADDASSHPASLKMRFGYGSRNRKFIHALLCVQLPCGWFAFVGLSLHKDKV